jgi:hypothetical protein
MSEHGSTTRLGASVLPETNGSGALSPHNVSSYRAVSDQAATADSLGPLKDLPGFWQGTGFNLIARPNFDDENEDGIFLELNMLQETVEFTSIGSPVYNRGSQQPDIKLYGVTYLHRVIDTATGGALHVEPGVWLNVPPTAVPESDWTVARLSSIPHGNSVCAVGFAQYVVPEGLPEIPPANTVPFESGGEPPPPGTANPFRAYDLSAESKYRTTPIPDGVTQELINDPNSMLRSALVGHELTHITRLITSTQSAADIGNIPFITKNANAVSLESVFAIEHVKGPLDTEFLQLQYVQTALLNFRGMSFPHVNVGTLIKAF